MIAVSRDNSRDSKIKEAYVHNVNESNEESTQSAEDGAAVEQIKDRVIELDATRFRWFPLASSPVISCFSIQQRSFTATCPSKANDFRQHFTARVELAIAYTRPSI